MNKDTARIIADALTWSRVLSVVPITLLVWYELKWWVFAVYVAAALTDLLDGIFARRATPSATETDFDGLADLVLSVMTLVWLWMLFPWFYPKYWLPYIPLLALLEIYMSWVRVRNPRLVVPHFEFGRNVMALFFVLLPVLIIWGDVTWFIHGVLILGCASKIQLALAFSKSTSSGQR